MLEKRFGPYETSPQLAAQQAREYERRAEGVAARADILVRDPELIVARIAEHRSTWDRAEAEREVRAVLDVGAGKEWDGPVQRVLDAALMPEHMVSLGFVASVNAEARSGRRLGDRPEMELDPGREIFSTTAIVADERTVLLVDEASMLGTSDARDLFEAARDGGAIVRLLGDAEQHGSVARGTVLADLSREHGAYDMALSRRAQEPWLREVASDLRAGLTSRALGELREHGAIAEHRTTGDAKSALIDGWARDVRAGRDVLLIATRRMDVNDLNERARMALRDRLGEERAYTTAFGERAFAIGEQLVARKADRTSETVNGDRLRVLGHREDGRIECERVRDGAGVVWDVKERPEIDYGYAATSYRSQGSTVDAVYVLATRADDQRGLYVDTTRAREHVMIAYGRDEVDNFGALLALGAQERGERSVVDRERFVSLRERDLTKRQEEIKQTIALKFFERERSHEIDFGR